MAVVTRFCRHARGDAGGDFLFFEGYSGRGRDARTTQATPNPNQTMEYFVGILVVGVRHYFPVGSRTAAYVLARKAASVHKIRSVADDAPVE